MAQFFDYAFALFIYLVSMAGIIVCIGGMIKHPKGVYVFFMSSLFFMLTLYLSGDMLMSMN